MTEEGIDLDLSGNAELKILSPLEGLPIVKLNLSYCGVEQTAGSVAFWGNVVNGIYGIFRFCCKVWFGVSRLMSAITGGWSVTEFPYEGQRIINASLQN